jgi:hypothetical protein
MKDYVTASHAGANTRNVTNICLYAFCSRGLFEHAERAVTQVIEYSYAGYSCRQNPSNQMLPNEPGRTSNCYNHARLCHITPLRQTPVCKTGS